MTITYVTYSNQGNRDYNEDFILAKQEPYGSCFVVADGLGGHGKGEVASMHVCEDVEKFLAKNQDIGDLEKAFEHAQETLMKRQIEENATSGMKTTMNVLAVNEDIIRWGHVGDTRTYYFKKNKIISRTKDHSVPQMMVSMGEIKEKDIRHHEDRNRLLKVMGIEWNSPQYAMESDIRVESKQAFLLCTDGFWEFIEDKEMEKTLKKSKTPQEWMNRMVEIVKKAGQGHNMDNFSAIVVWINN